MLTYSKMKIFIYVQIFSHNNSFLYCCSVVLSAKSNDRGNLNKLVSYETDGQKQIPQNSRKNIPIVKIS